MLHIANEDFSAVCLDASIAELIQGSIEKDSADLDLSRAVETNARPATGQPF